MVNTTGGVRHRGVLWACQYAVKALGLAGAIVILVSVGPETTTVPILIGMSIEDATAASADAKLTLVSGGSLEVTAASGLVGLVAEQVPAPGQTVEADSEVTVRIGVIKQVQVPDFSGMTIEQAQSAAAVFGLTVSAAAETVETPDPNLHGTVASQNPTAGTTVDDGSNVQLTFYRHVPPPTTTTTSTTTTTEPP